MGLERIQMSDQKIDFIETILIIWIVETALAHFVGRPREILIIRPKNAKHRCRLPIYEHAAEMKENHEAVGARSRITWTIWMKVLIRDFDLV